MSTDIYAVSTGEYSDYSINALFYEREDAEKLADEIDPKRHKPVEIHGAIYPLAYVEHFVIYDSYEEFKRSD